MILDAETSGVRGGTKRIMSTASSLGLTSTTAPTSSAMEVQPDTHQREKRWLQVSGLPGMSLLGSVVHLDLLPWGAFGPEVCERVSSALQTGTVDKFQHPSGGGDCDCKRRQFLLHCLMVLCFPLASSHSQSFFLFPSLPHDCWAGQPQ